MMPGWSPDGWLTETGQSPSVNVHSSHAFLSRSSFVSFNLSDTPYALQEWTQVIQS
jgi:hypothetical protein